MLPVLTVGERKTRRNRYRAAYGVPLSVGFFVWVIVTFHDSVPSFSVADSHDYTSVIMAFGFASFLSWVGLQVAFFTSVEIADDYVIVKHTFTLETIPWGQVAEIGPPEQLHVQLKDGRAVYCLNASATPSLLGWLFGYPTNRRVREELVAALEHYKAFRSAEVDEGRMVTRVYPHLNLWVLAGFLAVSACCVVIFAYL